MKAHFVVCMSVAVLPACGSAEQPDLIRGIEPPSDARVQDSGVETGNTAPAQPTLYYENLGPGATTINMGDADVKLFCFSLRSMGANFTVRLPLLSIHPFDGGTTATNSLVGTVFEFPRLTDGSTIVIDKSKVSLTNQDTAEVMTAFRDTAILVADGATRNLCVQADVVPWSITPEDFFGKQFGIQMDDWQTGDVTFADSGAILPREQIRAPAGDLGHAMTISAPGGQPPIKYTGRVQAEFNPVSPADQRAFPGTRGVLLGVFDLRATGDGSCIRGIDVKRHGAGTDADLETISLMSPTSTLYPTRLYGGKATFGWHEFGLLFCIDGGETVRLTISADVSASATPGDAIQLAIAHPSNDIDNVRGTAGGKAITFSTTTIVHP